MGFERLDGLEPSLTAYAKTNLTYRPTFVPPWNSVAVFHGMSPYRARVYLIPRHKHFFEHRVRVELTKTCLEGRNLSRSAYDALVFCVSGRTRTSTNCRRLLSDRSTFTRDPPLSLTHAIRGAGIPIPRHRHMSADCQASRLPPLSQYVPD